MILRSRLRQRSIAAVESATTENAIGTSIETVVILRYPANACFRQEQQPDSFIAHLLHVSEMLTQVNRSKRLDQ